MSCFFSAEKERERERERERESLPAERNSIFGDHPICLCNMCRCSSHVFAFCVVVLGGCSFMECWLGAFMLGVGCCCLVGLSTSVVWWLGVPIVVVVSAAGAVVAFIKGCGCSVWSPRALTAMAVRGGRRQLGRVGGGDACIAGNPHQVERKCSAGWDQREVI